MATVRENLITGSVQEDPLSSIAGTLVMAGALQSLPDVTPPDIARMTIDPRGEDDLPGSGKEIIHITNYETGAAIADIERGKENTTPRPHSQGSFVVHGPTVDDWDEKADLTGAVFTGHVAGTTVNFTGAAELDSTLVVGGATTLQSTLAVTGITTLSAKLIVGAGGVDVAGSPTGYTDEVRFTSTTFSGSAAMSTLLTGNAHMYFDHRGTSNTGDWAWRNGTGAASSRMALSAVGLLSITGGIDVAGSPSGYSAGEIRFSNGAAVLSTQIAGAPDMYFDHRAASNTGAWWWRNGTNAGTARMVLDATGQLRPQASLAILRGFGIVDQSQGTDLILYHDASNVYVGAVDGSRGAIIRGGGANTLLLTATQATLSGVLVAQQSAVLNARILAPTSVPGASALRLSYFDNAEVFQEDVLVYAKTAGNMSGGEHYLVTYVGS